MPGPSSPRGGPLLSAPPRLPVLACALALLAGCGGAGESSLTRGDRLLAVGQVDAALAEYKLARRQTGEETDVLLRLAHSYAVRGDVESSVRYYRQLVERDSSYRYQAALDLTGLARQAFDRGGVERLARTLRPVLSFGLELVPRDLRLELARYRAERAEFEGALQLYLSLREEDLELPVEDLYWVGRSLEELGACEVALGYFERYLDQTRGSRREGARWHYGRCLYRVAGTDRRAGRSEEALRRLDRLMEVGVPRTLMDRAQYMRGELLLEADRPEEALRAFQQVLRLNPARTGPLVRMAEDHILRIRYR